MKINVVRKTLESERLSFNVELILRSLEKLKIVAVNSVGVEFNMEDAVDKAYLYSWKRNPIGFENEAILSLYKGEDLVDILDKNISTIDAFDYMERSNDHNMSLIDTQYPYYEDTFNNCKVMLGVISFKPSEIYINCDLSTLKVAVMIRKIDDNKEIYLPNIALYCNHNTAQCIYMANKILNSPIGLLPLKN